MSGQGVNWRECPLKDLPSAGGPEAKDAPDTAAQDNVVPLFSPLMPENGVDGGLFVVNGHDISSMRRAPDFFVHGGQDLSGARFVCDGDNELLLTQEVQEVEELPAHQKKSLLSRFGAAARSRLTIDSLKNTAIGIGLGSGLKFGALGVGALTGAVIATPVLLGLGLAGSVARTVWQINQERHAAAQAAGFPAANLLSRDFRKAAGEMAEWTLAKENRKRVAALAAGTFLSTAASAAAIFAIPAIAETPVGSWFKNAFNSVKDWATGGAPTKPVVPVAAPVSAPAPHVIPMQSPVASPVHAPDVPAPVHHVPVEAKPHHVPVHTPHATKPEIAASVPKTDVAAPAPAPEAAASTLVSPKIEYDLSVTGMGDDVTVPETPSAPLIETSVPMPVENNAPLPTSAPLEAPQISGSAPQVGQAFNCNFTGSPDGEILGACRGQPGMFKVGDKITLEIPQLAFLLK